jgi:hypothetical protein
MAGNTSHNDEGANVWESRIRWILGVAVLIAVNFASVSYYAGGYSRDIETNRNTINSLELNTVNKDQFNELKSDLKEIRSDIKELVKDGRRK